jgi:hypothetical protein
MSAAAQFASVAGSILGYVTESADGRLRPIQGVLGSATIGAPLALAPAVTHAYALGARDFIISTDVGLSAVSIDATTTHTVPVEGAEPNPSYAVASSNGSSAALYYAERRRVILVTGLPARPTVSHLIDLPASLAKLKQLATDDAGTLLLFAVSDGTTDAIYAWTPDLPYPRAVANARSVTAIAVAPSGDALVADGTANELFWVRNARDAAYQQYLAGEPAGMSSPAGVMLMNDGSAFVANRGSSQIVHLDAAGGVLNTIGCGCVPSGLHRFGAGIYRLTDGTDQTMYLFDVGDGRGRVLFVPRGDSQ